MEGAAIDDKKLKLYRDSPHRADLGRVFTGRSKVDSVVATYMIIGC